MKASTQRNIARAGVVFTITDAAMTAGFGWLVASSFIMKPVYFGALGALSYVLAFLPVVAFALMARNYRSLAVLVLIIYAGGFGANFFSNYGLSAAVFKGNIIAADNANLLFDDARAKVIRLRKRDGELTAQINWKPKAGGEVWLAPKAYDDLIEGAKQKAEHGRNIFKRSKGCTDTTVKSSEVVCQLIKSLRATKENAIARNGLIEERKQIRAELKEAEQIASTRPKEMSIAANQSEYLARLFTQSLDPEQQVKDWTLIYVAVGISLLVSIFAHLCNLISALNLADLSEPEEPQYARNWQLPDRRSNPDPSTTAQAGREVYVLQSETVRQEDASRALDMTLKALDMTQARLNERFKLKGGVAT